jgi:pSer/pThr/pTyr-binding forkhead associated (FHA) protein
MARLVTIGGEMSGQSFDLKVEKTTIGRVSDNTIHIPHSSVSSHHCQVLLSGEDVVVKDLESKNGTFINNQQITAETVLKPGEILRLGQVEMRLETGTARMGSTTSMEHSSASIYQTRPPAKSKPPMAIIGIVVVVVIAIVLYFVFKHPSH